MQDFFEFLFDLLTLKSRKHGPLAVRAEVHGDQVQLTLQNQGKRKMEFAAVQGRAGNGTRCFPLTDLAVRTALRRAEAQTLRLDAAELRALDCHGLEVLDTKGKAWPVTNFDSTRLGD